ncbi:MAG: hypothetical protein ABIT36_02705 [Steroidobacteraceae bacterium]
MKTLRTGSFYTALAGVARFARTRGEAGVGNISGIGPRHELRRRQTCEITRVLIRSRML